MDPLDQMIQGGEPASNPIENKGQQGVDEIKPLSQTEEEVEFNKLSGSSQERFRDMFRRARTAEERNSILEQGRAYVPPAPNTLQPDQKQALETLSQFGVATDEKVDQKLAENFNVLRWELENQRLESKYSGQNGEPKYSKDEVEDFIRTHPQYRGYAPEDVFTYKMFPDEFRNLELQNAGTKVGRSSTLRPTKVVETTSAITPDNVEEMVRTHSPQWYEEHLEEINSAIGGWTRQFNNQGERV